MLTMLLKFLDTMSEHTVFQKLKIIAVTAKQKQSVSTEDTVL